VITAINADEQREIAARHHHCALYGEHKSWTHKKTAMCPPLSAIAWRTTCSVEY